MIFHDVSQIRSLEAVRKEFVANVSHELRTPFSIITGYLETLIDGGDDHETNLRFLRTMHKHAQRLNLLIEDLLALSQLESRKISLHFEPVDLSESIYRVLEQLDSRIRESGAAVTVTVPKHLPRIDADAFRIEQALYNLVDNALKHSGKSGAKISVEARSEATAVLVSISRRRRRDPAERPAAYLRAFLPCPQRQIARCGRDGPRFIYCQTHGAGTWRVDRGPEHARRRRHFCDELCLSVRPDDDVERYG